MPSSPTSTTWGLHPALVDLGTGFAMSLIDGYTGDELWVPVELPERCGVHDRLPAEVVAVATRAPGSTQDQRLRHLRRHPLRPDGGVCSSRSKGSRSSASTAPSTSAWAGERWPRRSSSTQPQGRRRASSPTPSWCSSTTCTQGIVPAEGRRAFARALRRADLPVVYVSSIDLAGLRAPERGRRAAAQARSRRPGEASAVFARPTLDSEFVAPRNDVEESLVAMWQELLGISQIGVQDSFFDLGGHSLIAVRLFAKVKKHVLGRLPDLDPVRGAHRRAVRRAHRRGPAGRRRR